MTLTFNPESYSDLLIRDRSKPIVTDADYEAAISLAEELEHRVNATMAEETLLELVVTLIEKYETTYEPIPEASGRSVLLHLMDAQDVTAADLVGVLGEMETVEEILSGHKAIDPTQAKLLGDRLNVPPQVFA